MPVEVLAKFEKVFGTTVFEGYGLSETSPVVCFNQPGNVRKPGSIGSEVRGAQLRVVDGQDNEVPTGEVGELVLLAIARLAEQDGPAVRHGRHAPSAAGRRTA